MKILRAILVVAMMAFVCQAKAETHYKPHISIGARGGVSLGQVSFSPSVKESWLMGSTGALTFRYTEEKLFGLIAELGWAQRGWRENYEGAPFSYSRSLTYINVPFLTHIYFGSHRFKCFINLGPQVGFMLGSKIDSDFDYRNPSQVSGYPRNRMTEQLWTEVSNRFDYGICGSLGCEFYVQPRHSVVVEGRYYFGLGNIFPSAKADTFGASRNMSIEVSLGYNFRIR